MSLSETASRLWSIAEIVKGLVPRSMSVDVILPLVLMNRIDALLAESKSEVLAQSASLDAGSDTVDTHLRGVSGYAFYNVSAMGLAELCDVPHDVGRCLQSYIDGFSRNIREIFDAFEFDQVIQRLDRAGGLGKVLLHLRSVDLRPENVPDSDMSALFEELFRLCSLGLDESSSEYSTPPDIVALLVGLLVADDNRPLRERDRPLTVRDPCCGSGALLAAVRRRLQGAKPDAGYEVVAFGNEVNRRAWAVCQSSLLLASTRDYDGHEIRLGSSFVRDSQEGSQPLFRLGASRAGDGGRVGPGSLHDRAGHDCGFDYQVAHPPFGASWRREAELVELEAKVGRCFPAGLPRISDSQMLFLQNLLVSMTPAEDGGGRAVFLSNASPLFTGEAGSGESEIRRWILANDWLEAVVALPGQLFSNTGIETYIWVLSNRKTPDRCGLVQLIDASSFWVPMAKGVGSKRRVVPEAGKVSVAAIRQLLRDFRDGPHSRVVSADSFGFRQVRIERPLRLRFQSSVDRIERVQHLPAYRDLPEAVPPQADCSGVLRSCTQGDVTMILGRMQDEAFVTKTDFEAALERASLEHCVRLSLALQTGILKVVAERDGQAEPVANELVDGVSTFVPDPEWTRVEHVPLSDTPEDYLTRCILPYEPEATIAGKEGSSAIGYSIDFSLFEKEKVRRQADSSGLKEVPSIAVIDRVVPVRSDDAGTHASSVYVPKAGLGPAVTSLRDHGARRTSYLRLQMRDGGALNADYFAEYLNTEHGRRLRALLSRSSTRQQISMSGWRSATLYLPTSTQQRELTSLAMRIGRMRADLETLSHQLWLKPGNAPAVARRVQQVGREREPSAWLDDLPFPIASILWAASQERRDLRKKAAYLDHFFEATAEFTATVLLSGFKNDPQLFEQERSELRKILARFGHDLGESTFGAWTKIVERLSKQVRRLLGDDVSAARIREAFRVADQELLEAVCNKQLVTILQDANALRNGMRGHGGAQDDASLQQHCAAWESLVDVYRAVAADAWASWRLVRPGELRYRSGVHECEAHLLMGPRAPFATEEIRLRDPAEFQRLHLYDADLELALELMPFVQMEASPRTERNACYFYNKQKGGKSCCISYHFAAENEIEIEDVRLSEAVNMLRTNPA